MSKGRRTPPLFDVLSGVEGRTRPLGGNGVAGSGGAGVGGARLPVQVQIPATAPRSGAGVDVGEMRPLSGERSPVAKRIKISAPLMWIGVACVLAMLAAAWFFGVQLGKTNAEQEFVKRIDGGGTPGGGTPAGSGSGAANGAAHGAGTTSGGVVPTPSQIPSPATQPGTETLVFAGDADPRQAGLNYLHIVTLPRADAEAAVAYLVKNGVRAGAVGVDGAGGKVDGHGGQANNPLLLVFVLEGVPSDRYKATAKERADLVDKIRAIGKQFQREERGASDFASPLWTKFVSR